MNECWQVIYGTKPQKMIKTRGETFQMYNKKTLKKIVLYLVTRASIYLDSGGRALVINNQKQF